MLEVFEPGALNCYTFFRPTPLTLCVSRNPILTLLPLSEFLDSLLCALIAPTFGLAFSLLMPCTLVVLSSFSSGRAYLSLNLLPPLSLFLGPYSDYAGINISLNNSSSLSFLNVYAPPIRSSPSDGRTDSFFPPFFSPPEISSIWGTLTAITPSGTQEVLPTPVGRKYSTGSSLLTSFPSTTLTYLPFYITPLAVAPHLTFPMLPPLSPFPVPGRCFRTWVLITYQFFYLSLSLQSFSPTSVPSFNFQKAHWDDFAFYFDSNCPSTQEYSSLFSFLCCCSFYLWH